MTHPLLSSLASRGVLVTARGGALHLAGAVTDAVRAEVEAAKAEILKALGVKAAPTAADAVVSQLLQKCGWCDRPGRWLCDYQTGPKTTCDRQFCDEHRHNVMAGMIDYGGKDKWRSGPFSVDRCPDHAPKPPACPGCKRPLDGKGRCWKCCYRECERCRKGTGSAFLALCIQCDLKPAEGVRGEA